MRTYKGVRFRNIRRWMLENGVTGKELARRSGVPESTMYNALNGRSDPGLYTVKALLRATGMTFEEAFREEEP